MGRRSWWWAIKGAGEDAKWQNPNAGDL